MPSSAPTRWTRRQRARQVAVDSAAWRPARRPSRLPAWIPAPLRKLLQISFQAGVVLLPLGLATALLYSYLALRFDLTSVASMPQRSVVLDMHGRELDTLHGENRRLITRDEIPPFFVEALQAREDKRFFEHNGIDTFGLARATIRNIRDMSFTQGASTLTMQLARNSFELGGRTLHRKLLEIAVTFRIEAEFSKDEILTCYLNRIYFGSGCHGLDEAARTYFQVPAPELNENQCALLAGIIRAPHACSPFRSLKGATKQRNEVLDRMVTENMITAEESAAIRAQPLNLRDPDKSPNHDAANAIIRRHFEELLGDDDVARGGLTVRSTIDAAHQVLLEQELRRFATQLDPGTEIAALILNPVTGGIEAAVGGRESQPGRFHRALDARRDLGSLFTPFVLTAAAERGISPTPDPVALGRQVGEDDLERLAKRFGFNGPFGSGDDFYRGTLSTTPLELATAAAVLANKGRRPRSHLIQELRTAGGAILFRNGADSTPVFSESAVNKALAAYFSASGNRCVTSTSTARCDAWALCFDSRHVICIWVGHDTPRPLSEPGILPGLDSVLSRLRSRLPSGR